MTGASNAAPERADIHVGTEAVLHRMSDADVVAFLEFDSEMLAPRLRAAEHALGLLARAGRIAAEVLIQTFAPDHEVIRAAVAGDPSVVTDGERSRRQMLSLPPFGALARVSGAGSDEFVQRLLADGPDAGLDVGQGGRPGDEHHLVRAADWMTLGARLIATERPVGSKVRIEVDPARV